MRRFNPNDAARNRLTAAEESLLEQLAAEWGAVWHVEFVGGPKCGWVWNADESPDAEWSYPAGGVVHRYELVGDRYFYAGAKAVTK